MYGLLAVFGPTASNWEATAAASALNATANQVAVFSVERGDARVLCSSPNALHARSLSLKVQNLRLILDGYLLTASSSAVSQRDHLGRFSEVLISDGLDAALETVVAGAFHLAILDEVHGHHALVSDSFGSIPLYVSLATRGICASTNPVTLRSAPNANLAPDWVGVASWALVGYTIGRRFLSESIEIAPPGAVIEWDAVHERSTIRQVQSTRAHPGSYVPAVEEIGALLRQACNRIATLDGSVGHLQSGGMDSRAILASWPRNSLPRCFTYGRPDSAEVQVARMVADCKGAQLSYCRSTPAKVAAALEPMFQGNGLFVYPDRFLVAQQMAAEDLQVAVDGYLGDVYLGGTYYSNDKYFPPWVVLPRLLARLVDQSVAKLGLEVIVEALYSEICDLSDPSELLGFVSKDFLHILDQKREDVLQDIHDELVRLWPDNDSISLLFRDFLVANRGRHAIAQQAVMCRQHVAVRFPFTNDFPLLRALLQLPPEMTAYRRYYIRLFRKCFPEFASIPYDSTMLPLARSPLSHKWSSILSSRGLRIPYVTGARTSRVRPIDWNTWIREDADIRELIRISLQRAGIDNGSRTRQELENVARGRRSAGGKLLHVAAAARWAVQC